MSNFKQTMAYAQAQAWANESGKSVHLSFENPFRDSVSEHFVIHPQNSVTISAFGSAEEQDSRTDTCYWQLKKSAAGVYNTDAPHPLILVDYDDQAQILGISFSGVLAYDGIRNGLDFALWQAEQSEVGCAGSRAIRRQVATALGLKNFSLHERDLQYQSGAQR